MSPRYEGKPRTIGLTAYDAGPTPITEKAMRAIAHTGNTDAMFNLGLLLKDQSTGRRCCSAVSMSTRIVGC